MMVENWRRQIEVLTNRTSHCLVSRRSALGLRICQPHPAAGLPNSAELCRRSVHQTTGHSTRFIQPDLPNYSDLSSHLHLFLAARSDGGFPLARSAAAESPQSAACQCIYRSQ
ncbi:hypothetical protein FIBSPDRAFT_547111 [Athelia psychrophila]|uniref:Uncharacterized protein n=1 Tax=Athelia psychrophila TaxID=1759441 RepID=A0A166IR13_9AGAM|nr:hypothetical protein FIBSPDRAFT_547111 [Fibularhizoctonia sp. CBS 109695]